jgi:predicted ester cyclase
MSAEQNKSVVRRFYEELWNGRDLSVADEIFADDCVTHQLQSGAETEGVRRGPAEVKHHVAAWLEGFPDLRFGVEELVAEGDLVVSRAVMRGTHAGAWLGIAPTGRRVSIRMSVTHRIASGKIVEDWVLVEALGFFQQLGLVPPTGEILSKAAG